MAIAILVLLIISSGAASQPAHMPLISRGVPVYASSQLYAASYANDADYSTQWRGAIPGWIAYDLSGVPAAQRTRVIVGWYNDPATSPYDHTLVGDVAYNNLRDYSVQANAAPGGGSAPSTGWVTLVSVTGNTYHSRQHLVDMAGYNWIRLNITAGDGSSGNSDAAINFDVHDASQGTGDSWIFYGDSITEDGTHHAPINGTGNFSQLINTANPSYYPAYEDGGTWGLISADGAQNIGKWLSTFPGSYVALDFGTNDANACLNATTFYNNYVTMVQAVLAAGKVPIVPTIPWARTANVQSCAPALNAKVQALYNAYPQIVKGPDFWTYFQNNQSLIGSDNLHPSTAGYVAYRQQWANAMLANVYNASAGPSVSLTPSALAFGAERVGTTGAAQSAVLKNTGGAPLTISSIAIGGPNQQDFTQTNNCPVSPSTLAPNATCTVSATFSPTATGTKSGSVQIADNATGSPQTIALSGTGTAPSVSFTPTTLAFGTQPVGTTSSTQSTTLQNTGTAPLAIANIALGGMNSGDYSESSTCPFSPSTVAPSATCTISVTFSPGAMGPSSGSLLISDDATGSPQSVALSGMGSSPAPAVTLRPSSLTFAQQLVGTRSGPQAATLTNSGSAPLAINSIGLAGTNPGDYKESDDCPLSPATLGAGGSCTISVTFAPTASGTRSANVSIADNATDTPQALALSGTGTSPTPAVTLSPTSLNFGAQQVGTTSASMTTQLTNSGTAPLTINSVSVTGTAADYAAGNDCPVAPLTLDAGASCTISVSFQPTTTGTRTAAVTLSDNAANTPQSVPLTGTGTAPTVLISPASLSFGTQLVGTTSQAQSATLKNSGTAPLTITSLAITGTNAADYTETTTCPRSPSMLAVNSTCTISVTFAPGALGPSSASVTVTDNASGSPHMLPLSGTGSNSSIAFDKDLGKYSENIGSSTMKMTTSTTASPRSRVFAFVTWENATRTLASIGGGGLVWTIDRQVKDASNNHGAIASADAPAGLPSGTVLTATFSGLVGHGLFAAASFIGISSTTPVDVTSSTTQAGVAGWSCSLTTTNPNDLLLAWSGIDANTTSTPTPPNVELYDFGSIDLYEWSTATYRVESSAGVKTVAGSWANAGGSTANFTACAAYHAG